MEISLENRLKNWHLFSMQTKKAVEHERQLRKELVEEILGKDAVGESRNKLQLGGTDTVICTVLNKRLDLPVLGSIWNDLSEEEQKCIKLKPTLTAAHKKLPDDAMLWQAIISTPGLPTIEVKG